MSNNQHTIARPVYVSGKGLHTGVPVTMTFKPAPVGTGYQFVRIDLEDRPIVRALVEHVVDTARGTTIEENGARVHTVEHTLAALVGQQIDNVFIELDGPEPPIMDGSAKAFTQALESAGRAEQNAPREAFVIDEPIVYEEEDRKVNIQVLPSPHFHATVCIDFESPVLKAQKAYMSDIQLFQEEFADCRTFCFLHEIEPLLKAGLIKGGDLESAVVLVDRQVNEEESQRIAALFNKPQITIKEGILNEFGLRYNNEPARHKLLDLVGDLALVGVPIIGHVIANRPGHKANVELAKLIKSKIKKKRITNKFQTVEKEGIVFDINAIQKILPHRYPFLLVDKITQFSSDKIVGVKNVTINEPFFQGHFPGNPIMPGVLQLEAMAQVGGILLLNSIDNPETVWVYIASIENAKFKKPVLPGDSLELHLELVAMRRNICKMTGKAIVDGNLVSSAEMIASIVPKNKS